MVDKCLLYQGRRECLSMRSHSLSIAPGDEYIFRPKMWDLFIECAYCLRCSAELCEQVIPAVVGDLVKQFCADVSTARQSKIACFAETSLDGLVVVRPGAFECLRQSRRTHLEVEHRGLGNTR